MKTKIRERIKHSIAILLMLMLITIMTGCSNGGKQKNDASSETAVTEQTDDGTENKEEASDETSKNSDEQVSSGQVSDENSEQKEEAAGFHVEGTKLLDANGNEFVIRGINHAHTWYRDKDGVALAAISKTGANSIRLVFSNGIQWTKDRADSVKRLIELCKQLNMIVIAEVHDGTGDDSVDTLESIAQYWIEIKDVLIGNEAYVILNIANEWVGSWKSKTWRDGYTQVIPELREAGIKNTIMVDAAGWGQYGKSIEEYGQEVFDSDPDRNTMFAIHMYGTSGKNESTIKKNLEGVTDQNLCVCVGEFGYKHSDGDVDEAYIMKYCTEQNIGYLGWSWKGNGGGVEYLDLAVEWDGSVLSQDWGEILINGEYGMKATSKLCSVFEQ